MADNPKTFQLMLQLQVQDLQILSLFRPLPTSDTWAFPGGCQSRRHKKLKFNPWVGKFPGGGNGNPLQYSCWEIPCTEEPGGLRSIGLHSRTQLKWLSTRYTCRRGRTRLRLRLSAHVRTVWSVRPLRPSCVRGLPAVFPGPALPSAPHVPGTSAGFSVSGPWKNINISPFLNETCRECVSI